MINSRITRACDSISQTTFYKQVFFRIKSLKQLLVIILIKKKLPFFSEVEEMVPMETDREEKESERRNGEEEQRKKDEEASVLEKDKDAEVKEEMYSETEAEKETVVIRAQESVI